MNNLSWLLFWADVLPSVSTWLCFVSFLMFAVSLFSVGIGWGAAHDALLIEKKWDSASADWIKMSKLDNTQYLQGIFMRKIGFVLAPVFFLLWGGSFLVPSKETFYLIAGSEMGEQALKTPEVDKIRKVINGYLNDQLPKESKEKSE